MNKIFFVAIVFTSFISIVSQAENATTYSPVPLDPSVEDFILKTGGVIPDLVDTKVPRPPVTQFPPNELKWKRFWDGSSAEAEAQGDLRLGFENQNPDMPSFSLSVMFTTEGLVLKHSNPISQKYLGGYRLRPDSKGKKSLFIEGKNGQGLVAIMPPVINPELEGVMLCPRDKDSDASPYAVPTLRDRNYRLASVRYMPRGSARGRFNSGTIDGLAKATIAVGAGASLPDRGEDFSKMPSPAVTLGYTGKPISEPLKVILASGDTFSTGIASSVELETMAGHKRSLKVTSDVFLKFFGDKGPENIVIAGIIHPIDPGSCLMVVQRDLVREDLTGPAVKAVPTPSPTEAVKEP